MQTTRSNRTRKLVVAAGLTLSALAVGTGAASAFPNGPVIIQDDPPPPPPPQNPDDKAPPPQQPQPPVDGPDELAIPEPGPVQPIPGPGPQQGGGSGGGAPAAGDQVQGGATAEELAAIADLAEAQADAEVADETGPAVDGTVGKESDRPGDEDRTELAAGELSTSESRSALPALLTTLAAVLIGGLLALWFVLARRRHDDEEAPSAA